MSSSSSIYGTFLASAKSVGTACTMAMVGVYLHQRGFVTAPGKRTLALISQQVTFPLFLFTKIIYCNQDWSPEPCPDVTKTLEHGWVLLIWPLFVVTTGLLVGRLMARLSRTPAVQHKSLLAAVAFGNSTGLPITLLTVVHANFPATSDLGRVDPTLFLSVYLLLYPVLQWGMGGWLLAPEEEKVKTDESESLQVARDALSSSNDSHADVESSAGTQKEQQAPHQYYETLQDTFTRSVLNHPNAAKYFENRRLSSSDEGIYLSETALFQAYPPSETDGSANNTSTAPSDGDASVGLDYARDSEDEEKSLLLASSPSQPASMFPSYQTTALSPPSTPHEDSRREPQIGHSASAMSRRDVAGGCRSCYRSDLGKTIKNVADRCFQPPVVGALMGMIVAMVHPLRGTLVDLVDRADQAPLEWIFDGLYSVGKAAVPINMIILGCNLSNSYNQYTGQAKEKVSKDGLFAKRTLVAILLGKMVFMPLIGILSAILLRLFVLDIPDEMDGSFYLVLMIVFLTPTANNVMVMVELSGANTKEGIASVIALQYAAAPIILSLTMSVAIGVASQWS